MRTSTRTDDIDNQSIANYSYDLNGRLVSDVHDGVTLIKWSKSDKVLEVHKPNGVLTIKYNALDQKVSQSTSRNDSIVTEYFVYDPSGNVLASYGDTITSGNHMFALKQLMIYGSSRVGVLEADVMLWSQIGNATPEIATFGNIFSLKLGQKRYELSNHLGNVSTVVSDRKLVDSHLGGQITAWKADVISVSDYYAFGMKITERSWSSDTYRFGFNGKDFFSDWNRQDYGFRIYDSRKCRFESVDPLHSKYPELTTYQFASNRCIDGIDLDGREYDRRSQSELVESSTLRTTTTPYLHQDKNLIWPSVNPKGYTITKVLTSGGIIAVCTYFNIPTPFTTALVNSNLAYWDGKSTKEIISAGAGGFVTGTIAGRIPIIGEISGKYFSEKQILQTPVAEYIKQFGVGGLSAVGGNIVEQQLNIFLGQNKEINNGEILSNFYIGGLFNGVFSLIKINVDVEIPSVKQTIGERATASSKQIPKPYIATPIESNGGLFEIVKEKLVIQGQLNGALEVGQDGYKSKISNTVNQNVESKKD